MPEIVIKNKVGAVFFDDNGDCWEFIEYTNDPIDATPTIESTHETCEACLGSIGFVIDFGVFVVDGGVQVSNT